MIDKFVLAYQGPSMHYKYTNIDYSIYIIFHESKKHTNAKQEGGGGGVLIISKP
jgi:hypothetical protein